MKHANYNDTLVSLAAAVARKTLQRRGVKLVNKRGVQAVVRTLKGEALPIVSNQMGRFS